MSTKKKRKKQKNPALRGDFPAKRVNSMDFNFYCTMNILGEAIGGERWISQGKHNLVMVELRYHGHCRVICFRHKKQ